METHLIPTPPMPGRILVGYDEQGLADNAVLLALALGDRLGARVELLQAVPRTPVVWPGTSALASLQHSAELVESTGRAALDRLSALLEGTKYAGRAAESSLKIVPGRAADVLLSAVSSPSDLIVLGAKRRGGALHFGGTLRFLLAKAPCPVWVQSDRAFGFDRILAPIDLSTHSLHALAMAVALAAKLRAKVSVLHAHHISYMASVSMAEGYVLPHMFDVEALCAAVREQFDAIIRDFEWHGVEHEELFLDEAPARAIVEQARSHDLIVMGTHGHRGAGAAILGNIAWNVLEDSETPLLVVREPARTPASEPERTNRSLPARRAEPTTTAPRRYAP